MHIVEGRKGNKIYHEYHSHGNKLKVGVSDIGAPFQEINGVITPLGNQIESGVNYTGTIVFKTFREIWFNDYQASGTLVLPIPSNDLNYGSGFVLPVYGMTGLDLSNYNIISNQYSGNTTNIHIITATLIGGQWYVNVILTERIP